MNIGQAARASGISAKMIRHYEQIGLLPAAARTDAGYRQYAERDVSVLRFIRRARRLGFSTEQIGQLIALWRQPHRASRNVRALAQQHVSEIEEKLREMAAMKATLERLVAACHGNEQPDCAILEGLAEDGEAAADRLHATVAARREAPARRRLSAR